MRVQRPTEGSSTIATPTLAVLVAATASAGAGLIHGAASGSHSGDGTVAALFAVCAAVQLAAAGAAVLRPERRVLTVVAAVNLLAVAGWLASRTTGWPLIDSMADPEDVGAQDLMAAALGGLAAVGALVAVARPDGVRAPTQSWAAAVGCSGLLLAVPFLAVGHTHEHGHDEVAAGAHAHGASDDHDDDGHAHDDEGDHGHGDAELAVSSSGDGHDDGHAHGAGDSTTTTSGGHQHDETAAPAAPHDHGTTAPTVLGDDHQHGTPSGSPTTSPPDDGHGHGHPGPGTTPTTTTPAPTGPIISLDDPRVTPAQRAAAQALIDRTAAAMAAFPTVAAVQAAGYASIGDGGANGYEHFVKWGYLGDGHDLDSSRIESIVVKKNGDGTKTVVSAMYILNLGKTMADVPDIAGELTTWHDHQNLCWAGSPLKVVALTDAAGKCPAGSTFIPTPPMLHVWMVPHHCGPFAAIDGHGDTDCGHDH